MPLGEGGTGMAELNCELRDGDADAVMDRECESDSDSDGGLLALTAAVVTFRSLIPPRIAFSNSSRGSALDAAADDGVDKHGGGGGGGGDAVLLALSAGGADTFLSFTPPCIAFNMSDRGSLEAESEGAVGGADGMSDVASVVEVAATLTLRSFTPP